jgi:hypothetical protein
VHERGIMAVGYIHYIYRSYLGIKPRYYLQREVPVLRLYLSSKREFLLTEWYACVHHTDLSFNRILHRGTGT